MKNKDELYEMYISGELEVKPKSRETAEREYVRRFIEKCELTEEQASELDDLIPDIIDYRGKQMFYDGYSIATQSAAPAKK